MKACLEKNGRENFGVQHYVSVVGVYLPSEVSVLHPHIVHIFSPQGSLPKSGFLEEMFD